MLLTLLVLRVSSNTDMARGAGEDEACRIRGCYGDSLDFAIRAGHLYHKKYSRCSLGNLPISIPIQATPKTLLIHQIP
ncbi:hypothetical protein M430DRAFT_224135 [Amorphotheca resinae ATCC 22711]|uniref:Secreted protein n=1 Tax=Amorphotheca resinae ATCC 22711 TaxID=857342 RepID=A0A2T3B6F8_AMORE|nr:hypothetical protein M430DRAFT_224135 [Amorphotheca resinae ATCC 22711]PSS22331.1 hypothetical protein M430DRAFT_224135 [Amorphotheca resinae ATCC 22711]